MRAFVTLFGIVITAATFAAEDDGKSTVPKVESAADFFGLPGIGFLRNDPVVIVYKTHFDLGYTARASEVVQEYRTEMADRMR